ncbi:BQ2448_277 [Microbotryum intermedium]|uniref:BQ2448_277 protein n=1 Tax=Microbotryum intermedium TaxID=269621 RepID=A0A238FAP5_9BASI|nr:BQ2448_277 [Microbotryum intermedium]
MDEAFLVTSYPLLSVVGSSEHASPSTSHLPSRALASLPLISSVAYTSTSAARQPSRVLVAAPAQGLTLYNVSHLSVFSVRAWPSSNAAVAAPALTVDGRRSCSALSSITLGSSFSPRTPPASRSTAASSSQSAHARSTRNTWIAVVASHDDQRGEIWHWTEQERKDGSAEATPSRLVYPTSAPIVGLLAPRTLPNHLLLLAETGTLALASSENLAIGASVALSTPLSSGTTRKPISQSLRAIPLQVNSNLLPRSVLELLPPRSGAHLVFVSRKYGCDAHAGGLPPVTPAAKAKRTKRPAAAVVVDSAEARARARTEIDLVLVDPEVRDDEGEMAAQPQIVVLGSVEVLGDQVVVNDEGIVTALVGSELISHRLVFPQDDSTTTYADFFNSSERPIETKLSLSVVKSLRLSSERFTPSNTTILALHSSFVLQCSIQTPSRSTEHTASGVLALIWDVRLGAVISSITIALPSSTSSLSGHCMALALPTPNTATLALAPLVETESSSSPSRIAIFSLLLSNVPSASVLAAVVGKQHLTRQYLAADSTSSNVAKTIPSLQHSKTSPNKTALLDASIDARSTVLRKLEPLLRSGDVNVDVADSVFNAFVEDEAKRLRAYHLAKLETSLEKERERRVAALQVKEALKANGTKYKTARRKIEEAIQDSGVPTEAWPEVTAKRIKGVSDVYRYKYYEDRKQLEANTGSIAVDQSREKALAAIEKLEPVLPSSFVTTVLRLCFPGAAETTASNPGTQEREETKPALLRSHPRGILSYLLKRGIVGDGQFHGSLVRELASAEDWTNILLALRSMPDVPEPIMTSTLRRVIVANASSDPVPAGMPRLSTLLRSLVACPFEPARLREAFLSQLTAVDALAVLEVCDRWLGWWNRHESGGVVETGSNQRSSDDPKRKTPKRLPLDPFAVRAPSPSDDKAASRAPPRVESILRFVQALLDAQFIALLLHRPSHALLRRLATHVDEHLKRTIQLEALVGPLAVYARVKSEQKKSGAQKGELGIDKGLGESMRRRVEAQEKHARVAMYEIEQFNLG